VYQARWSRGRRWSWGRRWSRGSRGGHGGASEDLLSAGDSAAAREDLGMPKTELGKTVAALGLARSRGRGPRGGWRWAPERRSSATRARGWSRGRGQRGGARSQGRRHARIPAVYGGGAPRPRQHVDGAGEEVEPGKTEGVGKDERGRRSSVTTTTARARGNFGSPSGSISTE
jgi:hypothetical protein